MCFMATLDTMTKTATQEITFATDKTKQDVYNMWKSVFGDDEKYVDLYFSDKYKNENTLLYIEDGKVVSSLQMWEYEFSYYDKKVPFYYLAGLATYPEARGKGYMKALIERSFEVMKERNIPLSILIPAEESLFYYYEQFGYVQVFYADDVMIPLGKILSRHKDLEKAYDVYDRIYNKGKFKVLKTFEQFQTIVKEQALSSEEVKTNLDGVARLIDVKYFLKLYAKHNKERKFTIKVVGDRQIPENNAYYTIEDGVVTSFKAAIADFEVDILQICELLMGQDNDIFSTKLNNKFPKFNPTMNLMLE